ncbi:MAG: DUF1802 family protein [Armatimonadetes bacterium]|nr:DUF1802 family protein [Armatimonadota bacterium]
MPHSIVSNVALKEWAITCEVLSQGRQIILLRKGGLLDEDGHFSLEHGQFFLLPTYLHQEEALVKPAERDLFRTTQKIEGESINVTFLRHFARVEAIWSFPPHDDALLERAPHIWSRQYLDLRLGYLGDKPLLCAALRVWKLNSPLRYQLRAQDKGCRSWVEMETPLECGATPVVDDETFGMELGKLRALFG